MTKSALIARTAFAQARHFVDVFAKHRLNSKGKALVGRDGRRMAGRVRIHDDDGSPASRQFRAEIYRGRRFADAALALDKPDNWQRIISPILVILWCHYITENTLMQCNITTARGRKRGAVFCQGYRFPNRGSARGSAFASAQNPID